MKKIAKSLKYYVDGLLNHGLIVDCIYIFIIAREGIPIVNRVRSARYCPTQHISPGRATDDIA